MSHLHERYANYRTNIWEGGRVDLTERRMNYGFENTYTIQIKSKFACKLIVSIVRIQMNYFSTFRNIQIAVCVFRTQIKRKFNSIPPP